MIKEDRKDHENALMIYTLGQFLVRRGDEVLSSESKRSYRIWELGKYFLTHRKKSLYSETIMVDLWPDRDYTDSKQALRTQIFRLRSILDLDKKEAAEEQSYIRFSNGCYSWNTELPYWLDAEQFELLYQEAVHLSPDDSEKAIQKYQDAAGLYRGDYLPDTAYAEWAIPPRSYYNRLYLQLILNLTCLLSAAERHQEIIETLENAFLIEFFEEELHFRYLRSLIAVGRSRQAQAHYEYTASVFYREMGVEMSDSMRDLYRKLLYQNNAVNRDLHLVQEDLDEENAKGAFLCTTDVFKHLYNLEARRSERNGQSIYLGMITLSAKNDDPVLLNSKMGCLQDTLLNSLRLGDVVSRWNESQYLILLPEITLENAEMVMRRINFNFKRFANNEQLQLNTSVKPVRPGTFS